jgi:hypothetical protein
MRTKGLVALAAVVAIGAAYLAGSLTERRARSAAEARAGTLETRLADADADVRLAELLGLALTLKEVAMRQDYGQARDLSTSFFDAVSAESSRSSDPGLREGLNQILMLRDRVTAALATADPAVVDTLHTIELNLRRSLGYPLPPEPGPTPS